MTIKILHSHHQYFVWLIMYYIAVLKHLYGCALFVYATHWLSTVDSNRPSIPTTASFEAWKIAHFAFVYRLKHQNCCLSTVSSMPGN